MKRSLVGVALLACAMLCLAAPVRADETNQPDGLTVAAVGNDDLLSLRVGVRPWGGRTEIGGFGIWLDGLAEENGEAWGGGVYATYDVVQDAQFTVLSYSLPATIYVGGQLGVLERENSETDAVSSLLTGLSFGDDKVRIGVEYQYLLDQDLWKELGAIDDQGRLLLTLSRRF